MWTQFTERARKVVFFAQEEAAKFDEHYVSTEHLLLGLLRDPSAQLKSLLDEVDIVGRSPDGVAKRIRAEITTQMLRRSAQLHKGSDEMTLNPRAKRVIDLAYDEVRSMGVNYLHDTHLFLGLLREGDGLAGRVLAKCGFDLHQSREFLRSEKSVLATINNVNPNLLKLEPHDFEPSKSDSNNDDKIKTLKMLKLSAIEAVSKVFDDLIKGIQKS